MANLQNWKVAMEGVLTGTTPVTDGSGVLYHFIDSLEEERGQGQHRELLWRISRTIEVNGETPLTLDWLVPLELFLHRRDRTYEAFVEAVEHEKMQLANAWSGLTAMGTGAWGAVLQKIETVEPDRQRPKRAGGVPNYEVAKVIFLFLARTGEDGT